MRDFVDVAARVMSASEQRLEHVATNVSNASTPGFKRQGVFQIAPEYNQPTDILADSAVSGPGLQLEASFAPGSLKATGKPFDLAIDGAGFFSLQGEDGLRLTRGGQFQRLEDGTIVSAQGYALQDASGGDLVVGVPDPQFLTDGTVLENGLPTGRVALVGVDTAGLSGAAGGALFRPGPDTEMSGEPGGLIRQGMLEGSNVAMPAEMLEMMEAVRQAETGARLIQLYDTLMGRAISTFGQRS